MAKPSWLSIFCLYNVCTFYICFLYFYICLLLLPYWSSVFWCLLVFAFVFDVLCLSSNNISHHAPPCHLEPDLKAAVWVEPGVIGMSDCTHCERALRMGYMRVFGIYIFNCKICNFVFVIKIWFLFALYLDYIWCHLSLANDSNANFGVGLYAASAHSVWDTCVYFDSQLQNLYFCICNINLISICSAICNWITLDVILAGSFANFDHSFEASWTPTDRPLFGRNPTQTKCFAVNLIASRPTVPLRTMWPCERPGTGRRSP